MSETWGNAPRRAPTFDRQPLATYGGNRKAALTTWSLPQPEVIHDTHIERWRGKRVWGQVGNRRCEVTVLQQTAPTGEGVAQFLVQPLDRKPSPFSMVAVPITKLELKPPCMALMIVPPRAIIVWNEKAHRSGL